MIKINMFAVIFNIILTIIIEVLAEKVIKLSPLIGKNKTIELILPLF